MYFKPIPFLFSLFYITLLTGAIATKVNDRFAVSKSQHYIVQLKPSTDIDDFIPHLLKGIFDLIGDVIGDIGDLIDGATHLEKRTNPVHIFEKFNINHSFKALSTRIEKDSLLGMMVKHFDEIESIVPDDEIQFDLPQPQSLRRRYYMRHPKTSADGEQPPHGEQPSYTKRSASKSNTTQIVKQLNAPWNLARITERKPDPKAPYLYPKTAGEGVRVYVIDDGINKDHMDFGNRASWGYSAISKDDDSITQIGGGHGTHVAGIIGGKEHGVAKNVDLVSVQVLAKNGRGAVSSLLSGIQWVTQDAMKYPKKSIVNMSLGIPSIAPSANTLDQAITAAAQSGLPIIVAAGNTASDACDVVPAGNPNVYTVANADKTDTLDYRSCYGKCVAITAPGVNVESDYIGGKNATAVMSGTSMAAPHVTGIAALILQELDDPSPKSLFAALTSMATKGAVKKNRPDTVNLLAYNDVNQHNGKQTPSKKPVPKKKKLHRRQTRANKD